jgi:hypothetical protein
MLVDTVVKMRDLDPVIEYVELTNGKVVGILPADAGADELLKESKDDPDNHVLAKELVARVLQEATPADLLTLTDVTVQYILARAFKNVAAAEKVLGESSGAVVRATASTTPASSPEIGTATSVNA